MGKTVSIQGGDSLDEKWDNFYRMAVVNFYLITIGAPLMLLFVSWFLWVSGAWIDIYWMIPILAPVDVALGFILMKPMMLDAKKRYSRNFGEIPIEYASSRIQAALDTMGCEYERSDDVVRRGLPRISYVVLYEVPKEGFEVGVRRIPAERKIEVVVRHKDDVDIEALDGVFSEIDRQILTGGSDR